jgi:hypothetical protein
MIKRAASLPIVFVLLTLFSAQSFAQETTASPPANRNSLEAVANEIELVRKSLQTLNTRVREINEKIPASGLAATTGAEAKPDRLAASLDLLARAEDRVGVLRKQLLELIEKDTSYRSRLAQLEEDSRPESVERVMSGVGTTRTPELRDSRRRALEIEKRGLETLVQVAAQNRPRLEEDVRQAIATVARLRQRLLPLIEKEIDKINPNLN